MRIVLVLLLVLVNGGIKRLNDIYLRMVFKRGSNLAFCWHPLTLKACTLEKHLLAWVEVNPLLLTPTSSLLVDDENFLLVNCQSSFVIANHIHPSFRLTFENHLLSSQLANISLCSGLTWVTSQIIKYSNNHCYLTVTYNLSVAICPQQSQIKFTWVLKNFAACLSLPSFCPILPTFLRDQRT